MLIRVATIGYARQPDFEVGVPGTVTTEERIAYALLNRKVFRDACVRENIDLRPAKRVVEASQRKERERTMKEKKRLEMKQSLRTRSKL